MPKIGCRARKMMGKTVSLWKLICVQLALLKALIPSARRIS